MATNRTRKSRKFKPPGISDALRNYFETGSREPGNVEIFMLLVNKTKTREAWEAAKDEILSDWKKQHPCSRPPPWWRFDAPEIRRRFGGIGDLWHDLENYKPMECCYGIPYNWITQSEVDFYNGRELDIHGNPMTEKWPPGSGHYKEGDFKKVAVDENDSPIFESQCSFLDRLDLLTPTEKKYLKSHPELLEPETLEFEDDEN